MTKKLLMLLGTILGNVVILAVCHLWPDIPSDVITWAIGGISSAGVGGVLGQGFADGLSKGLTSSAGKQIIAAGLRDTALKNSPAPGSPE